MYHFFDVLFLCVVCFFFFKQKTAYEMRISDWSSDVCSSDLCVALFELCRREEFARARDLYRMLTPSFHLDTHVKLVQYIKLAEHLVYGAPEWTRSLRLPLVGEERADRKSTRLNSSH